MEYDFRNYKKYIKALIIENKEGLIRTNKNKTFMALIDILEEEILNFSYSDDTNITYIFDLFNALSELIIDDKALNHHKDRFTYIHNIIKNYLHSGPNREDKKEVSRYRLLKNIMNKMEDTMLLLYIDSPDYYDPNKEEYLSYITFKQKNIMFFRNACEKFPYIVNMVNKDDIPLVEIVVDKYLESLSSYLSKENFGPIDDLVYYDKVLKEILRNDKLKVDEGIKKILLEKINNYLENNHYTLRKHKEKQSFFVNNAISNILDVQTEESLESLGYKYDVNVNFNESHNLEAKTIYMNKKYVGPITTKRKIYTFDGEGACELDDGLSISLEDGIYHLGVHIADPTAYIKETSILMDEAKRRTTSLYMENDCIPLYPFLLSSDLMSLNVGKNTYCMSYYYDIDAISGELKDFKIKREICQIAGNLTYDYFDECLSRGVDNDAFLSVLINLKNVSKILKKIYDADFVYRTFHNDSLKSDSRLIVESAMIYTNYNVSKLFSEKNLPFIYRCHNINDIDIKTLNRLQERLSQSNDNKLIVQEIELLKNLFPRAFYTRHNSGHYGLGIDYYTHATSPLRRLADNIVNMCINKFIFNEYTSEDVKVMNEFIDEISEVINTKRKSLEDYEKEYLKLKYKKGNL